MQLLGLLLASVGVTVLLGFAARWVREEWDKSKNKGLREAAGRNGPAALLCAIVLVVAVVAAKTYVGVMRPGAFFERGNYTAKVYVLVFPGTDTTKNYYLPADVTKEGSVYSLNKLYWPNGGDSTFNDCEVRLIQKSNCQPDGDDTNYAIELTGSLKK
jgi:hypothetical protein